MREPLRLFVASGSIVGAQAHLTGADARRLLDMGSRAGDTVTLLDDSGWELDVTLDRCSTGGCSGIVVGRRLASERRTKVSLYQGLLHPADFRRLLTAGTRAGVVSFVPVVTEASPIASIEALQGCDRDDDWLQLVRSAAESAHRGNRPTLGAPMLLDHAFDDAGRWGGLLVLGPKGLPLAEAVADRPFSIALFSPPPGGFTPGEVERAGGRGARLVAAATGGPDPVRSVVGTLEAIYAALESSEA